MTAIVDDFGAIQGAMPSAKLGTWATPAPEGLCLLLAETYGLPERWYIGSYDREHDEWVEENGNVVTPRKWHPLPSAQ